MTFPQCKTEFWFTLLASLIVSTLYKDIIFFCVYWVNFDSVKLIQWILGSEIKPVKKMIDVTISVVVNNYNDQILFYKIKHNFFKWAWTIYEYVEIQFDF